MHWRNVPVTLNYRRSPFGRGVLTARECEVARLLLEGHSNISVSQRLRISP
ncbi:LuxR C-terminal-related transcriptional regulator [Pseudomonas sp. BN417]|uniref:LuxR C-terminal-related transcriptional regulator n=1 Tax=Pseudomonas sp. BN417 TaxID=2567890 RepID=UPI002454FD51|nr:LuxR C-terminal-related transcriptional regulator [Pseudomonas sp. BN417]